MNSEAVGPENGSSRFHELGIGRGGLAQAVVQAQGCPFVGTHLVEGQDFHTGDAAAPLLDDAGNVLHVNGVVGQSGTRTKRTQISMPLAASRSPKAIVGASSRPVTFL